MRDDFAIFILSHGRADRVKTIKSLNRANYTGKYYFICDDEDEQIDKYKENFGDDKVIVFSKSAYQNKFDIMDNFSGNKVIVYARNAAWDIAKQLGLTYFLELEDDYSNFRIRYSQDDVLRTYYIREMDYVIDLFIDYLDKSNASCIAFAQSGELMGGTSGGVWENAIKRKVMNTLFCKTDRKFLWLGRMNDDVNTYLQRGKIGDLFLQFGRTQVDQEATQKSKSRNTTAYLKFGTYVKSFYSVMIHPSACKVSFMGNGHYRVHHKINWNNAVPKIVSSDFRKED